MAVWVGYPDELQATWRPSTAAAPVAGGTFPTEIWHDFMRSWIGIRDRRDAASGEEDDDESPTALPRRSPIAPRRQAPRPAEPEREPTSAEPRTPSSREPASPRRSASRRRPPTPAPQPTPPPRPRRRRQAAGRAAAPLPADGPPSQAARRRVRRMAGGHGRETQRLAASQNRHGSSTAA